MGKVELRGLTWEDTMRAFFWRNDPKVYRWTRQNYPLNQGEHDEYWKNLPKSAKMFSVYAREGKDAGKHIGVAGLIIPREEHRNGEFSLYIAPEFQHQGYGKEALEKLFYIGFCQMDLHMIVGETFEDNPALNIFMEIGMKQDGKLRERYYKEGAWTDIYALSMKKEEFLEKYSWLKPQHAV